MVSIVDNQPLKLFILHKPVMSWFGLGYCCVIFTVYVKHIGVYFLISIILFLVNTSLGSFIFSRRKILYYIRFKILYYIRFSSFFQYFNWEMKLNEKLRTSSILLLQMNPWSILHDECTSDLLRPPPTSSSDLLRPPPPPTSSDLLPDFIHVFG